MQMNGFATRPIILSRKLRRTEKRKQLKKRKRKRIFHNFAVAFIVVALICVVSYMAFMSIMTGVFNISEIEVTGNEILTNDQVINASGIREGENIFLLDLNKIRYNISVACSANEIYIQKVLPNKIIISIEETQPIGVINNENKNYYIDSNGQLMETTQELGKDDTPLISGFNAYKFNDPGKRIVVDPAYKLDEVLNILQLFESNNLLGELSEISLTDSNAYRIITKNGVVFTVKDFNNLQEYYNYVSTVIENRETNQDINLMAGNNPIKKAR